MRKNRLVIPYALFVKNVQTICHETSKRYGTDGYSGTILS